MGIRCKFVQKHLIKKKESYTLIYTCMQNCTIIFASQIFITSFSMDLDCNVWRSNGSIFIMGTKLKGV